MNVLLLTDKLIMGGAEIYFCKLENNLQHPGFTFYFAAGQGELLKKIKHKQNFIELSRKNHFKNVSRLAEIIRKKKISMIHANSLRMVFYSILIKKLIRSSIKIIYTKHNVTSLEKKLPSCFKYLLNKYVDRVITVSEFEEENLKQLGIDVTKLKTIYNGVDLQQFLFQQKDIRDTFNVGILGRLSQEKNHELFLEIANRLRDIPNIYFHIAGDGPEKQNIARTIHEFNLSHKINMAGEVENPENFIKDMDVLLLTSYREVFPMVILEAMAVGTPIISIDRGGIREAVIEEQTGFLLKQHSSEDFSHKIVFLETTPTVRMKVINGARQKVVKDFSLDQMLTNTLNEYMNIDRRVNQKN